MATSTRRANDYRRRMRERGYRPVQVWVPAFIAAAITAFAAGCSSTQPTTAGGSAAAPPATSQTTAVDRHRSDGTTFDPCTAFSASDLTKWGVETLPHGHAGAPGQPARGCQWNAPACAADAPRNTCWSLTVTVANQTIADYVRDQGAHEQTVVGRAGATSMDGPLTCYLMIPAQKATVSVSVTSDNPKVVDPCGKANALAPDVANYLPPPD